MPLKNIKSGNAKSASPSEVEKKIVETKLYKTELGSEVEVSWREFDYPENSTDSKDGIEKFSEKAVIFLPGWSIGADTKSAETLGEAFAKNSKNRTYAITTRVEHSAGNPNLLSEQAEAIGRFIKEKRLEEITLAGHSQGGDKAIDVAARLQNDPGIKIKGLILLDSMGLYEQTLSQLAEGFIKDSLLNTPKTLLKNIFKNPLAMERGMRVGMDVVFGIVKEMAKSKFDYTSKLMNEIKEMAEINPNMAEIKVPVILISGSHDPISSPDKIIPDGEEENVLEEWKKEEESSKKEEFIDPREEFLKKNIFPNSPYVRMVVPNKFANHSLPYLHAESVARASLYLLERFKKREEEIK